MLDKLDIACNSFEFEKSEMECWKRPESRLGLANLVFHWARRNSHDFEALKNSSRCTITKQVIMRVFYENKSNFV